MELASKRRPTASHVQHCEQDATQHAGKVAHEEMKDRTAWRGGLATDPDAPQYCMARKHAPHVRAQPLERVPYLQPQDVFTPLRLANLPENCKFRRASSQSRLVMVSRLPGNRSNQARQSPLARRLMSSASTLLPDACSWGCMRRPLMSICMPPSRRKTRRHLRPYWRSSKNYRHSMQRS